MASVCQARKKKKGIGERKINPVWEENLYAFFAYKINIQLKCESKRFCLRVLFFLAKTKIHLWNGIHCLQVQKIWVLLHEKCETYLIYLNMTEREEEKWRQQRANKASQMLDELSLPSGRPEETRLTSSSLDPTQGTEPNDSHIFWTSH